MMIVSLVTPCSVAARRLAGAARRGEIAEGRLRRSGSSGGRGTGTTQIGGRRLPVAAARSEQQDRERHKGTEPSRHGAPFVVDVTTVYPLLDRVNCPWWDRVSNFDPSRPDEPDVTT